MNLADGLARALQRPSDLAHSAAVAQPPLDRLESVHRSAFSPHLAPCCRDCRRRYRTGFPPKAPRDSPNTGNWWLQPGILGVTHQRKSSIQDLHAPTPRGDLKDAATCAFIRPTVQLNCRPVRLWSLGFDASGRHSRALRSQVGASDATGAHGARRALSRGVHHSWMKVRRPLRADS